MGVITGLSDKTPVSQGYLTKHQSLANYVTKSDASKFITLEDVNIPSVDGLASKDWVSSQGYLTKHQSLSGYAKKSDIPAIPSLDGYATEAWVLEKIPEVSDLDGYVSKAELTSKLSGYVKTNTLNKYARKSEVYGKNDIDLNFLNINDAEKYYLKKADADAAYYTKQVTDQTFLKIEDYRGLGDMMKYKDILDSAVIIKEYNAADSDSGRAMLENDIQNDPRFPNGFYVVNYPDENDPSIIHSDMYIVNNRNIVGNIKDGIPQSSTFELVWEEDEE